MTRRLLISVLLVSAPLLLVGGCRQQPGRAADTAAAMRGMFLYQADAAVFTRCDTGERMPVALRGDYLALERAYLESRPEPGVAVLATFAGHVADLPPMEGDGSVPTVVVDRFEGVWPGETCGNPGATEALENTYWKLTRLQGQPVRVAPDQREPHLVLQKGASRAVGTGGCNQFSGGYELAGDRLRFGDLLSTMMACPQLMDQEQAFLQALGAVAGWRIEGQHLELLDTDGRALSRLEARAFP